MYTSLLLPDNFQLDAAKLWLHHALQVSPEEAITPPCLDLFIEFYWLLYRSNGRVYEAQEFLHRECKKRRMDYRPVLDAPLKDTLLSTRGRKGKMGKAKERQQASTPNGIEELGKDAVQETVSRRKRRRKAEDAYGADVEDNARIEDVPAPRSGPLVAPATRSRTRSSKVISPSTTTADRARSVVVTASAEKVAPDSRDSAIEPPDIARGAIENTRAPVVSRAKRGKKRKGRKHGASSASRAETSSEPENVVETRTRDGRVEAPNAVTYASESSLTSLSSSSDDESAAATTLNPATHASPDTTPPSLPSRSSSTPVTVPVSNPAAESLQDTTHTPTPVALPVQIAPRRVPPRRAANRQNLSEMMAAEARYQQRARRGKDVEDVVAIQTPAVAKTSSSAGKNEVQRADAMNDTAISQSVDTALQKGGSPNPAMATPATTEVHPPAASAGPAPRLRGKTVKKPRIPSVRDQGVSRQVAKRRKRNDGFPFHTSPPVEKLSQKATTKNARSITVFTEATDSIGQAGVAISQESAGVAGQLGKRGRTHEQDESIALPDSNVRKDKDRRATLPLPKTRKTRSRTAASTLPTAPPLSESLSLGLNASSMDTIIHDAATGMCELLACTDPPAEEWIAKPDENVKYDSDSDDELPLSRTLASGGGSHVNLSAHHDAALIEPEVVGPKVPLREYPPIWAEVRKYKRSCGCS